jgi:hypothetical protein
MRSPVTTPGLLAALALADLADEFEREGAASIP